MMCGQPTTAPAAAIVAPAVREILSQVQVEATGGFWVRGERHAPDRGRPLVARLAAGLYEAFHAGRPLDRSMPHADEVFVGRLAAAHPITDSQDPGWLIVAHRPDERWVVEQHGVQLTVESSELVGRGGGVGDVVSVRLPAKRPSLSPGFFSVVGSGGGPSGACTTRFYCNLLAEAAPDFFGALAAVLEETRVRYAAKTLSRPQEYGRFDGTVVYVDSRDARRAGLALRELVTRFADAMNAPTPRLALALSPGLAMAEDPAQSAGRARSFGEHRCHAIAAALATPDSPATDEEEALAKHVGERLRAAGIDPARPHLNLDSRDHGAG